MIIVIHHKWSKEMIQEKEHNYYMKILISFCLKSLFLWCYELDYFA